MKSLLLLTSSAPLKRQNQGLYFPRPLLYFRRAAAATRSLKLDTCLSSMQARRIENTLSMIAEGDMPPCDFQVLRNRRWSWCCLGVSYLDNRLVVGIRVRPVSGNESNDPRHGRTSDVGCTQSSAELVDRGPPSVFSPPICRSDFCLLLIVWLLACAVQLMCCCCICIYVVLFHYFEGLFHNIYFVSFPYIFI